MLIDVVVKVFTKIWGLNKFSPNLHSVYFRINYQIHGNFCFHSSCTCLSYAEYKVNQKLKVAFRPKWISIILRYSSVYLRDFICARSATVSVITIFHNFSFTYPVNAAWMRKLAAKGKYLDLIYLQNLSFKSRLT